MNAGTGVAAAAQAAPAAVNTTPVHIIMQLPHQRGCVYLPDNTRIRHRDRAGQRTALSHPFVCGFCYLRFTRIDQVRTHVKGFCIVSPRDGQDAGWNAHPSCWPQNQPQPAQNPVPAPPAAAAPQQAQVPAAPTQQLLPLQPPGLPTAAPTLATMPAPTPASSQPAATACTGTTQPLVTADQDVEMTDSESVTTTSTEDRAKLTPLNSPVRDHEGYIEAREEHIKITGTTMGTAVQILLDSTEETTLLCPAFAGMIFKMWMRLWVGELDYALEEPRPGWKPATCAQINTRLAHIVLFRRLANAQTFHSQVLLLSQMEMWAKLLGDAAGAGKIRQLAMDTLEPLDLERCYPYPVKDTQY